MEVKFMKPGHEGRRRFVRRETDIVPAKGRTVKWGDHHYIVLSVVYDLNVTPGAAAAGEMVATVQLA